jgi:hypothetical protein
MAQVDRDFVMRAVKQLAELLARALRLKREQKYDEAAQTLEGGCGDLLGFDFGALALVDSPSCAQLLGDAQRIRTFASLLEELADVHRAAGDEAKARARARHAHELFGEVLKRKADDAEAKAALERLKPLF